MTVSQSPLYRGVAPLWLKRLGYAAIGTVLASSMALGTGPVMASAAGTTSADPGVVQSTTITVSNQTGTTQDGSKMSGPGLKVGDYYYSIGKGQIDSSAGGIANLNIYRGKDWTHKNEFVATVIGPETSYDWTNPETGKVEKVYPLANAKSERLDFEQTADGKFVVWMHWEMKQGYAASEVLTLEADRIEGPYRLTDTHHRPGASTNVGRNGEAGSNDNASAMGNREGQLIYDSSATNTEGVEPGTTGKLSRASMPHKINLYNAISVKQDKKTKKYYVPEMTTVAGTKKTYGTSMTGNSWTYQFQGLTDTLRLRARAVRMTDFDLSMYEAAVKNGVSKPDPDTYVGRYPALKGTDGKVAAGVSSEGYDGGSKTEAYDPNPYDTTTAGLGELDASAAVGEDYTFDENAGVGDLDTLKAPLISPRLDENAGSNAGKKEVVVRPKDMAFVTPQSNGVTIYATSDGSDPRTSETRWTVDNRWTAGPISISDKNGDGTMTLRAVAKDKAGNFSDVVETTFRIASDTESQEYKDVPVFQPVMNRVSGNYPKNFGYQELRVYEPTYGAEVYYTMDGSTPIPARYGQNTGFGSRDYALFTDTKESGGDGKAYLITGQDHVYMRVWELNESMTDVVTDREYDINVGDRREAPQAVRSPGGDFLYLFTSGQSGWYKNQAMYQRSANPAAGFDQPRDAFGYRSGASVWTKLQPFADNTTYNSQVGGVWNLGTKDKPVYLFNGSRWTVGDLSNSTTVWLPMTIDDDKMGPGAATGEVEKIDGTDDKGQPATIEADIYKPEPGLVQVKYTDTVNIDPVKGTLEAGDGTDEAITIAASGDELGKVDPDDHTPRVIDYQDVGELGQCDVYNKNGWETCPGGKLEQEGIIQRLQPSAAFDGVDWDVDNYDGTEGAYKGSGNDFFLTMDLGQPRGLTSIAMSFKAVSGSDNAHRYSVFATNTVDDKGNPTDWQRVVNMSQNNVPGFQAHDLRGLTYRYVKYQNTGNQDMAHGKSADWSRGLYELQIRAIRLVKSTLKAESLEQHINQAEALSAFTDRYTEDSLKALAEALAPAQELLKTLRIESEDTAHTQAEIDAADAKLTAALDALKVKGSVSLDGLRQAIAVGKAVKKGQYTDASVKALNDAIAAGEKALTSTDQAEIDAAAQAIVNAVAGLEPKPTETPEPAPTKLELAALTAALNGATELAKGDYTADSIKALNAEIDAARKLLDAAAKEGTTVTQSDVDAQTVALLNAVFALKPVQKPTVTLNYADLQAAIKEGTATLANSGKYTDKTVAALKAAVDKGAATLRSATAQGELDAAAQSIRNAIKALEVKPVTPTPTISTATLEALIAEAEQKNATDYTDESWAAYAEAVAKAKDVVAAPKSQDEVDAAAAALVKAGEQLVKAAETPAPKPEQPENDKPNTDKPQTDKPQTDKTDQTKSDGNAQPGADQSKDGAPSGKKPDESTVKVESKDKAKRPTQLSRTGASVGALAGLTAVLLLGGGIAAATSTKRHMR